MIFMHIILRLAEFKTNCSAPVTMCRSESLKGTGRGFVNKGYNTQ